VIATSSPALALKFSPWRSRLLLIALLGWFVALVARAAYLQGLHNDFLQAKGELRYSRVLSLSATRGMIVDRNSEPLAISTPVESVAASPADTEMTSAQLSKLARLLEMEASEVTRRLSETKRDFVYLKRQLPPEQAAKIVELNIPGVFLQREYRRYYPGGEVMAHLIGFTDIDEKGQEALELAFDSELTGKPGSRRVIKDRRGHIIEDVDSIRLPQDGAKLALSIDARIQYGWHRRARRADRRNSRDGEPAYVQPEQSRQVRSEAHPQSRGHRSLRAGVHAEAFHGGGCDRGRCRETRDGDPDCAGSSHHRQPHDT
jgi:cell division protein FtsI (penicillin-binding protein 3)